MKYILKVFNSYVEVYPDNILLYKVNYKARWSGSWLITIYDANDNLLIESKSNYIVL